MDERMKCPDEGGWQSRLVKLRCPLSGAEFQMRLGTLAQLGFPGDGTALSAGDVKWVRFLEVCGAEGVSEWRELSRAEVTTSRGAASFKEASFLSNAEALEILRGVGNGNPQKCEPAQPQPKRHLWSAAIRINGYSDESGYTKRLLTRAATAAEAARKLERHVRDEIENPPKGLGGDIDYSLVFTELRRVADDAHVYHKGPPQVSGKYVPTVFSMRANPGANYHVVAGSLGEAIEWFFTLKPSEPVNRDSIEEFRQLPGTYIH